MPTTAQTLINQVAAQGYDKLSRRDLLECLLAAAQGGGGVVCGSLSGVGSPAGVVTPLFTGQLYEDTGSSTFYRSTGVTPASWVAISGGGGCTYQDMQVAWTPTTLKLSENIGFFTYGDFKDPITDIVFDCVTNIPGFDIESNSQIQTISWPNLTSVDPTNIQGGYIVVHHCPNLTSVSAPSLVSLGYNVSFRDNASLTTIDLSSLVPTNGTNYSYANNALGATSVNGILARFVANAGYVSGTVNLSGQTPPAPPSGQGVADVATLTGRGVTVITD